MIREQPSVAASTNNTDGTQHVRKIRLEAPHRMAAYGSLTVSTTLSVLRSLGIITKIWVEAVAR